MNIYRKKYTAIFVTVVIFSLISFSGCTKPADLSGDEVYAVDLDGDGEDEVLRIRDVKVTVANSDGRRLGDFKLFDYSDTIEFVDLSKNGCSQIAVWTQADEGYSQGLVIYALENDKLHEIFKIETGGEIKTNFSLRWPIITVDYVTWMWNGKQFIQKEPDDVF